MWIFGRKGSSGFSYSSNAEEVTRGIHGNGLTAIVTGASSGIGAETTRVLAMRGVHVVMAVRNMEAGRKVEEEILKEIPTAKLDVMELDLSSMDSVRKFASEYNSSERPLNLLINNAGIMATPFKLSKDNIELQFATNHLGNSYSSFLIMIKEDISCLNTIRVCLYPLLLLLGHFLLTNLLLDTMKRTAQESNIEGRIAIVSSGAHKWADREGILFDKINDESRYSSLVAYGQSKLANILHAKELSRRFKEEGVNITANSLHPGGIVTNLLRHHSFMAGIIKTVGKLVLKNVQQGAATTCYVALHPQVKGISGEYFMDSNFANPSYQAKDQELARKLWDFSLSLTDSKQTRESSS